MAPPHSCWIASWANGRRRSSRSIPPGRPTGWLKGGGRDRRLGLRGGRVRRHGEYHVPTPAARCRGKPYPLCNSRGTADGGGFAAALVLGAYVVNIGTRLLASAEAGIDDE